MEAEERPTKLRKLSNDAVVTGSVSMPPPQTKDEASDIVPPRVPLEPNDLNAVNDGDDATTSDDEGAGPGELLSLPPPEETAPLALSGDAGATDPPLSKNQQKKLRKKQEWEAKREDRKLVRKEKLVAKRERKRAARQEQNGEGSDAHPAPVKKPKRQKPVTLPVTFLIDCDFDDLMRDNERISLAAQVTRSYSDNKNSLFRAHLAVCSFNGKLRERFDNVLSHYKGWRGVKFLECDFVEAARQAQEWMSADEQSAKKLAGSAFAQLHDEEADSLSKLQQGSEIVYLTSESDETLTELKPYSTYIIGGLVDKNREKGICYKRARQSGVKTARLPIGEFMELQSRKVLATNHVNEIMLKWLECRDWGEAFMKVIPKRKGGKLRGDQDKNDDEVGDDAEHDGEAQLGEEAQHDQEAQLEEESDRRADATSDLSMPTNQNGSHANVSAKSPKASVTMGTEAGST